MEVSNIIKGLYAITPDQNDNDQLISQVEQAINGGVKVIQYRAKTINIIQKKDRTIKEYRLFGRLYMIKITPTLGFPYFLTDTDGDGSLETTQHELDSGLLVPSWVLLKW